MSSKLHNQHRDRGAVAAEFALLIPIILMLVFGMIQLGLTYQRQESVNAAAREGARVASLPTSSTTDACNRAASAVNGSTFTGTPTCTVSFLPSGNCSTSADSVVVTIAVQNTIEIPFFGTPTFTLTGRGDFRCE